MTMFRISALLVAGLSVSGCVAALSDEPLGGRQGEERWVDSSIDSKPLSQLVAGVWIDPNGCDHWIIDDGLEGYLSARLDDYGRPVCSGLPPNYAIGPFQDGSPIPDPI